MQTVIMEICGNNELSWEEAWIEKIEALCIEAGFKVQRRVDECHDLCTECAMFPYLILNHKVLMTESIEALYEEVRREIDKIV